VIFSTLAFSRKKISIRRDDLLSHLISLDDKFREKMEDTDLYSPRKSLIIASMNEGIQEDDYDAMLKYFNQVGYRELADFDTGTIEIINKIMGTWVLPFSDSWYITNVEDATGNEIIFVISLLITGTLSNSLYVPPSDWYTDVIADFIEDVLVPYPLPRKIRDMHTSSCILHQNGRSEPLHMREIAGYSSSRRK
jgi:hypothetical protein